MKIILKHPIRNQFISVDIKLRDGSICKNIAIDANGDVLGKVVGGQDGLDHNLPFSQVDIVAYRRIGLAARFGLSKWHSQCP